MKQHPSNLKEFSPRLIPQVCLKAIVRKREGEIVVLGLVLHYQ